jgi:hypothetical protein
MTVEEDVNRALAAIDQASSATSAERLEKSLRDARRALEDVERDVRFGPPAP